MQPSLHLSTGRPTHMRIYPHFCPLPYVTRSQQTSSTPAPPALHIAPTCQVCTCRPRCRPHGIMLRLLYLLLAASSAPGSVLPRGWRACLPMVSIRPAHTQQVPGQTSSECETKTIPITGPRAPFSTCNRRPRPALAYDCEAPLPGQPALPDELRFKSSSRARKSFLSRASS